MMNHQLTPVDSDDLPADSLGRRDRVGDVHRGECALGDREDRDEG